MSRPAARVVALALGLALPGAGLGRSVPAGGGAVRLAVPPGLAAATREALGGAPLFEPQRPGLAPLVPGAALGSRVVRAFEVSADGLGVHLASRGSDARALADGVTACLGGGGWSAQALAAAGVRAQARPDGDGVGIALSAPFGPLPELLAGCVVPIGAAFEPTAGGRAFRRASGPLGALLERVDLVEGIDADVLPGTPGVTRGDALAGPWPDVILLAFDAAAQRADPFGLGGDGAGLAGVRAQLAADLLVLVRWGGRGGAATGALPAALGPSSAPSALAAREPPPLALAPLPAGAPTLVLPVPDGQPLLADLRDRLALLLRARGWALVASGPGPGARIVAFRAPSPDPALAALALAGALDLRPPPDLLPGLRAADPRERVAAAHALDAWLLRERLVLPLAEAAHWIDVHPRLAGVRLRADGVPILDDAVWSAP